MRQTADEVKVPKAGGSHAASGGASAALIALGLTAAILVGGYLGFCAYANTQDVFYGNYSVNGVDIGGMTLEQATETLAAALPEQTITVGSTQNPADEGWASEVSGSVTLGELGYTAERCADIAQSRFESQQTGGFISRGAQFLSALTSSSKNNVSLEERDEAVFRQGVAELAEELALEPQEGSYEVEGNTLAITKAANGRSVQTDTLAKALEKAIEEAKEEMTAKVAFDRQEAQPITAQAVHDAVSGEMKNAGYDIATGTIIPEQVGADFDVAQAQRLLNAAAPGETITIEADIQMPAITAEELKSVLFRDLLGECTTHVSGSAARINNVKLSSAAFNGTILNSGDVFSYNDVVGQRTVAKGYQAAPAFIQGETVDEIGGGVCQPSSTLYYACLLANLEITERYAHRYVCSYITVGMDATVSWGGPDYKFTNNTDYPLKIVANYANNYITVQLYGTKTDDTTVKMTYETLSTTPYQEVEKEDPSLAPGTRQVSVTPYTGRHVKTYRNIYDGNGNLISSAYEATSDYKSRDRVTLVGPAAPVETPAPTEPSGGETSTNIPTEAPTDIPVTPPTDTSGESDPPEETFDPIIIPPAEE